MAALGKDLLRKRGSSCESLPLYAVNEVPAKEEEKEEAPNEVSPQSYCCHLLLLSSGHPTHYACAIMSAGRALRLK
eukprot:344913-Pelagomonas_calceolata.AAC.11